MRRLRQFGYAVAGLAGALIVVVAIALGIAHTGFGRAWIADLASGILSDSDRTVRVGRIDGSILSGFTIDRVTVADRDGEWLAARGLALDWSPSALAAGIIDIERLDIAQIEIARPPLPPRSASTASPTPARFEPPKLRLGSLKLGEVALGAPVLGAAARVTATAAIDSVDPAAGLSARIDARRIDGIEGALRGTVAFVPGTRMLDVDIAADEPAGGLISRLAGIAGLPALRARIVGKGTLDDWTASIELASGADNLVKGTAHIQRRGAAHRLSLALDAAARRVVPAPYAALLGDNTRLRIELALAEDGVLTIERADLEGGALSARASGRIGEGLGSLELRFTAASGAARLKPNAQIDAAWRRLAIAGTLAGTPTAPSVTLTVEADALAVNGNAADALRLSLDAKPIAAGAAFALALSGHIDGAKPADRRMAALPGGRIEWQGTARVDRAGRADIAAFTVKRGTIAAAFAGQVTPVAIVGTLKLHRFDLAAIAGLVQPGLAGELTLEAAVDAAFDGSRLALGINGAATNFKTGVAPIDGLLGGRLDVAGSMTRAADGTFGYRDFALRGLHATLTIDGAATAARADVTARLTTDDIARADPRLTGTLTAFARMTGSLARPKLEVKLDLANGSAMGRRVELLSLGVNVADLATQPTGAVTLSGTLDGKPVTGGADIATEAGGDRVLRNARFAVGSARLDADLRLDPQRRLAGTVKFKADELRDIAALMLTEISGRVDSTVTFSVAGGTQRIAVEVDAAALALPGIALGTAKVRAELADPLGTPALKGAIDIARLRAGGTMVDSARIVATGTDRDTRIQIQAGAQGADLRAAVRLTAADGEIRVRADELRIARNQRDIRLGAPAEFRLRDGRVSFGRLTLVSGTGSVTIEGRAAETLDLRIGLRALPLAALAFAAPDANLDGTLAGDIQITGTPAAPVARYDIAIARLSNAKLTALGAGPFAIKARGTANPQRLQVEATVAGPAAATATLQGTVPLGAGTIALAIKGKLDLGIANTLLATQGARLSGPLTVDVAVSGTAAAPRIAGTVQLTRGRFEDPINGFLLDRIDLRAEGTNDSLTITRLSAMTRNGGTVTGEGRIAIDPAQGFPGRFSLRANNALLVASETVSAIADARLELTGALATQPRIAGRIDIRNMEINVPDRLPGGVTAIEVRHVNVPARLRASVPKPRRRGVPAGPQAPAFSAILDLAINAPVRVFVRGRGIDAELGGNLTLRGSTMQPILAGGFELKRGRLDLLGKTLAFSRGRVTFPGELDPTLDFVADANADDVVASITVSGRASDPKFAFSSMPALPQDEVLSRLFFGRPTSRLTTGQALQLAQVVAQLSGAGGPGILDAIRKRLGVDTLDVGTGPQGNAPQIGVGRRINERIYLGVRQGTSPSSSRATVDIDITKNIKIQGEVGSDSSTSIGIGAEWNY